jgi:hypothetical protein
MCAPRVRLQTAQVEDGEARVAGEGGAQGDSTRVADPVVGQMEARERCVALQEPRKVGGPSITDFVVEKVQLDQRRVGR